MCLDRSSDWSLTIYKGFLCSLARQKWELCKAGRHCQLEVTRPLIRGLISLRLEN